MAPRCYTTSAIRSLQLTAATLLGFFAAPLAHHYRTHPSSSRSVVSGSARAVLFSPSGHRLYVGRATEPLLVLDRFEGSQLKEIELPGAVIEALPVPVVVGTSSSPPGGLSPGAR